MGSHKSSYGVAMRDRVLTDRENKILSCVVESYVQTATPVGSRNLASKYGLNVSPATIRNVMNDLEELGFLCQPHVSAGRIPTDKGYRFYVNGLMSLRKPNKREKQLIFDDLQKFATDLNDILAAASRVLGRISTQLGVVLEPRFYQGVFRKMELVSVSEKRIMAVISIESGLVKTIMMEMESDVSRDMLEQTSWIINERLSGLSLSEVKETIDKRLSDVALGDPGLLNLILASSARLFDFATYDGLHFSGAQNIMIHPEFSERAEFSRVLGLMESKETILHKFTQADCAADQKVYVRIGRENAEDLFHNWSVVSTRYHIGNVTGSLGVVGPTRMHYARIIPLVDYVGGVLTQMFSDRLC